VRRWSRRIRAVAVSYERKNHAITRCHINPKGWLLTIYTIVLGAIGGFDAVKICISVGITSAITP